MASDDEEVEAVRRGYWLRRARVLAGITLSDAAVTAGLEPTSGSTVSLWEHGKRRIRVDQMKRLARRYGVPADMFLNPKKTDDERLAEAVAEATRLALEDEDAEEGRDQQDDDGPTPSRRRR